MAEYNVGDLIVVDDRAGDLPRPVGIVTDRDLVVRVLAHERVPSQIAVGDVMHSELVTALESDDLESVLGKLRSHAIRRIPIVDREGRLQGIISLDDLLEWLHGQIFAASGLVQRQRPGDRAT